jgi:predicted DNA-binding transcriptional regulator YafY
VHLRLRVEWPDEVAHSMLRLGSGVEVLTPVAVREEVVATARRILDRYGEAAVEEATAAIA